MPVDSPKTRGRPRCTSDSADAAAPQARISPPPQRLFYRVGKDLQDVGLGSRSNQYKMAAAGLLELRKMLGATGATHAEVERCLASLPPAPIRPARSKVA